MYSRIFESSVVHYDFFLIGVLLVCQWPFVLGPCGTPVQVWLVPSVGLAHAATSTVPSESELSTFFWTWQTGCLLSFLERL